MTVSLILNGTTVAVHADNLAQLLAERGIGAPQRFVAVAVNNVVVGGSEWPELRLRNGDRIEIVQPMKGG